MCKNILHFKTKILMPVKFLLFSFFLLYNPIFNYAQYENIWVFGSNRAGLDFNSGTPVAFGTSIFDPINQFEANASVCDANGKFLFYTNGNFLWDQNYDTMQNGSS